MKQANDLATIQLTDEDRQKMVNYLSRAEPLGYVGMCPKKIFPKVPPKIDRKYGRQMIILDDDENETNLEDWW